MVNKTIEPLTSGKSYTRAEEEKFVALNIILMACFQKAIEPRPSRKHD